MTSVEPSTLARDAPRRRRALIISPIPTHPSTRGNSARILYFAERMERWGFETWFLHTSFQSGDDEAMSAWWGKRLVRHRYKKPWRKFRFMGVPVPDRWHHGLMNRGWLHQRVDQLYDESLDETLDELQSQKHFDLVLVEYVTFSRSLLKFGADTLKLIDSHDIYTGRHKRLLRAGMRPEWFFLSRSEELKGLMRADRVIAIQDQEKAFFQKLLRGRREVHTVGYCLPVATGLPLNHPKRIVYLGADATLNVRSMLAFLQNVWPGVHAKDPAAELHVWGGICKSLDVVPDAVVLHGEVADVAEAYAGADIAINPMIEGTGLKTKTIEALAHGRAVVASPVAVEGLPLFSEVSLVPWEIARNPAEWAAVLINLMSDGDRRAAMSRRAFDYARTYVRTQEAAMQRVLNCGEPISGRSDDALMEIPTRQ